MTSETPNKDAATETIFSAAIGPRYARRYAADALEQSVPWLDPHWESSISTNTWTRWDGTTGTAQEHMIWMRDQVKSLFSEERASEFRPHGQHDGCRFYIHPELTAAGDGYGCFKIEGRVFDVQPRDVLRICFDMQSTIDLDATAVFYKMMKPCTIDNKDAKSSMVLPVYWCNDPGFPFSYRDGIDLTGFLPDQDPNSNVIWQVAVGVNMDGFSSQPGALQAKDRYWAYRLEPVADGGTKVSIICQCCLHGWIPKFLSNYFVCKVLTDTLGKLEKKIAQLKAEDTAGYEQKMKDIGLGDW